MPGKDRQQRILELDGLRGIAIVLVLCYHYGFLTPHAADGKFLAGIQQAFAIGWSGVDLFFVLSGFLIGGILLDSRDSPRYFPTFYLRRFFRIIPLYYLWITAYFVLTLSPALLTRVIPLGGAAESWRSVPIYLFFVQNFTKNLHSTLGTAWLSHLWSLAVEEQFYLFAPLAVRFLPRRLLVALLIATIAGAPLARIVVYKVSSAHAAQYMLTPCRADALSLGVLLAVGWRSESWKNWIRNRRKLHFGLTVLLGAGFIYLAHSEPSPYSFAMTTYGFSTIDLFFAFLLSTVVFFPGGAARATCRWPVLREIGKVSYCMYIIHAMMSVAIHHLLRHDAPQMISWQGAAVSAIALAATYGVARVSWAVFEGPLLQHGHRFQY